MGVLFHDGYNVHPEVWRSGIREGSVFIKIDARITIAHYLGYGARIALAGLAAGAVLGPLTAD